METSMLSQSRSMILLTSILLSTGPLFSSDSIAASVKAGRTSAHVTNAPQAPGSTGNWQRLGTIHLGRTTVAVGKRKDNHGLGLSISGKKSLTAAVRTKQF